VKEEDEEEEGDSNTQYSMQSLGHSPMEGRTEGNFLNLRSLFCLCMGMGMAWHGMLAGLPCFLLACCRTMGHGCDFFFFLL